jgi:hypothetical protein
MNMPHQIIKFHKSQALSAHKYTPVRFKPIKSSRSIAKPQDPALPLEQLPIIAL